MKLLRVLLQMRIYGTFTRFVNNQWLSMGPVAQGMLNKIEPLCEFFLKGKFNTAISNSERFKRICGNLIENKMTMACLQFIRAACSGREHS